MAEEKKKKKSKKEYEFNPELETQTRMEETELDEALTRMGRIRLARALKRSAKSGKLQRGKRKMAKKAMTQTRAKKLGVQGSWRNVKKSLAGGKSTSSLTAAQRSRVEKLAKKRVAKRSALARSIARSKLRESVVDDAFALMLEGKRYHQLLTKENKPKLDRRFKAFKKPLSLAASVDEAFELFHQISDMSLMEAAVFQVEKFYDPDSDFDVSNVADNFGVDFDDLRAAIAQSRAN